VTGPFGFDQSNTISSNGSVSVTHVAGTAGTKVDGTPGAGEAFFAVPGLHQHQQLLSVTVIGTGSGGSATLRLYSYSAIGTAVYTAVPGAIATGAGTLVLTPSPALGPQLGANGDTLYVVGINCGSAVIYTAKMGIASCNVP
jgi:hypothetical protein